MSRITRIIKAIKALLHRKRVKEEVKVEPVGKKGPLYAYRTNR